MERLTKSRSWDDWKLAMPAADIGRTAAMLEAGVNKPAGRKYNEAFRKWARLHNAFEPIASLDKSDRSRLFECFKNLDAIDAWRARLSPARQLKLNYPPTVLAHWKKSQQSASPADASPAAPKPPASMLPVKELRRQLEILGLPRFRQEVLPEVLARPSSRYRARPRHAGTADRAARAQVLAGQGRTRRAEVVAEVTTAQFLILQFWAFRPKAIAELAWPRRERDRRS